MSQISEPNIKLDIGGAVKISGAIVIGSCSDNVSEDLAGVVRWNGNIGALQVWNNNNWLNLNTPEAGDINVDFLSNPINTKNSGSIVYDNVNYVTVEQNNTIFGINLKIDNNTFGIPVSNTFMVNGNTIIGDRNYCTTRHITNFYQTNDEFIPDDNNITDTTVGNMSIQHSLGIGITENLKSAIHIGDVNDGFIDAGDAIINNGKFSTAMGSTVTIREPYSFAYGNNIGISGEGIPDENVFGYNLAMGKSLYFSGNYNLMFGENFSNLLTPTPWDNATIPINHYSFVMGKGLKSYGNHNFNFGIDNILTNCNNSLCIGNDNEMTFNTTDNNVYIIGESNQATITSGSCVMIGKNCNATNDYPIAIGVSDNDGEGNALTIDDDNNVNIVNKFIINGITPGTNDIILDNSPDGILNIDKEINCPVKIVDKFNVSSILNSHIGTADFQLPTTALENGDVIYVYNDNSDDDINLTHNNIEDIILGPKKVISLIYIGDKWLKVNA